MNKFTYALALGAGLALGLAAPSVRADAIQSIVPTTTMTASQFNADFTPSNQVLSNTYTLSGTPTTGVVESQVFQGNAGTPFAGYTAYAYQFAVNNVSDSSGQPTFVNSAAMNFNAPPVPATVNGTSSSVLAVTGGQVGGITAAPAGTTVMAPSTVTYVPGSTNGSLDFNWLSGNSSPLPAGGNSGTIVVLTQDQNFTTPFVSILNPNPQAQNVAAPQAYAPATSPSGPAGGFNTPEPATIIGWTSVVGALALVRRVRRNRPAA
jgi:hypothetical protein